MTPGISRTASSLVKIVTARTTTLRAAPDREPFFSKADALPPDRWTSLRWSVVEIVVCGLALGLGVAIAMAVDDYLQ